MTERPSDLPDFSSPPVVETVLSVQFDRLKAAHSAHFGLYWREVLSRFQKRRSGGNFRRLLRGSLSCHLRE